MRWRDRIGHDLRVLLLALLAGSPGTAVALFLLWSGEPDPVLGWIATLVLVGLWIGLATAVRRQVARPLQTLANVLAALREGDFSIRARVRLENADDPLSLAYHEINQLEDILRVQRIGAVEATELLRKVLEEVDLAIYAFDDGEKLRLLNQAGERLLGQPARRVVGMSAEELRLADALRGPAPRTLELAHPGGTGRWEVRRSRVRQEGFPLRLLVLADLSRALREEERLAWKRIIRVLSHEINNSLAPIKSISGSLATLVAKHPRPADLDDDLARGLEVIETRAEALGRFMSAYANLARLPRPVLAPVDLPELVGRVARLESRLRVEVRPGAPVVVQADRDQIEQALINLIRNAVDATLDAGGTAVTVGWERRDGAVDLLVDDEGPGLSDTSNLFVPFYTTKPGGSGIGLVLSRQIAEGHAGDLELEDRPDRAGARARMSLPVSPSD